MNRVWRGFIKLVIYEAFSDTASFWLHPVRRLPHQDNLELLQAKLFCYVGLWVRLNVCICESQTSFESKLGYLLFTSLVCNMYCSYDIRATFVWAAFRMESFAFVLVYIERKSYVGCVRSFCLFRSNFILFRRCDVFVR